MKTTLTILLIILLIRPLVRLIEDLREKAKPRIDKKPTSPFYRWKEEDADPNVRFPWKDVFKSKYIGPFILQKGSHEIKPCPKCQEESKPEPTNTLVWVYFRSPAWTWRQSCGRAGYLSICTEHKKQVDFICTVMN